MWSTSPLFGKYEFVYEVREGSFSKVYQATDISNDQSVAVKVFFKTKIGSIKREVNIMRLLRHPSIVRIHEVLESKTNIYLIMEYVKCGNLSHRISKGRITENLSRKYFQQLISVVSYCHKLGVYHRDLKPENILIDEYGDLKVADFGISATRNQVREDKLLHTTCGTPVYVAPEILRNRGYDGAKTDVWSCGVILYELIAGYLPFYDPSPMLLYNKVCKGKYRCPDWMSSELKRFLSRLLDPNPRTRISVDEIKHDPWFKKGLDDKKICFGNRSDKDDHQMTDGPSSDHQMTDGPSSLNAFHLISFSPVLHLSGFFDESCSSMDDSVRLVVEQSPEMIMDRASEVAKEMKNASVERKNGWWCVELHCHDNTSAEFIIGFEVFRLINNIVILEVEKRGGAADFFHELWEKKIKPTILGQL